jgi:F-type H+-transporting ATPase subunit a
MLNVSIAAEKIGSIWGFPLTNSLLATWVVMAVLALVSYFGTRNLSLVPSGFQQMLELIVGGLHDFYKNIVGEKIDKFFPLLASLFLFIIVGNYIGLLPGVGTIGFNVTHAAETAGAKPVSEFVPLLRGVNADLNTTLALALIAFFAIQYFGFKYSGIKYTSRFVDFTSPMKLYIGILETISELSKVISFAFRLFGNIFAGEVLLAVMAFLFPYILPLPFLALELFVGMIQALVFSLLTAVFSMVAMSHAEHAKAEH